MNFSPPFRYFGYKFFGSVNGLLCLSEYHDDTACVCNPLTREYVKLPRFNLDSDSNMYKFWTRGFGYLPSTNEYKVVEVNRLKTDPNIVKVSVYTVGSGNGWRNVGSSDLKSGDAFVDSGVCANGALYWVNKIGGMVFVFDLAQEKFGENISPPPKTAEGFWHGYSLGVSGGDLYFDMGYGWQFHESNHEIWLLKKKNDIRNMKEQVEQETLCWSKEFSMSGWKPFAFTKTGGVLYFEPTSLSIYDTTTSTSKELVCFSSITQIFPHTNTLVSLKELGEEGTKIMHPGKLIEDRKPFFPTTEVAN